MTNGEPQSQIAQDGGMEALADTLLAVRRISFHIEQCLTLHLNARTVPKEAIRWINISILTNRIWVGWSNSCQKRVASLYISSHRVEKSKARLPCSHLIEAMIV